MNIEGERLELCEKDKDSEEEKEKEKEKEKELEKVRTNSSKFKDNQLDIWTRFSHIEYSPIPHHLEIPTPPPECSLLLV